MSGNDHGWGKPIGSIDTDAGAAAAFVAPMVSEREHCGCPRDFCIRKATAEDLLCNECREFCR